MYLKLLTPLVVPVPPCPAVRVRDVPVYRNYKDFDLGKVPVAALESVG